MAGMQGLPTEAAGWLGWAGIGGERRGAEGWGVRGWRETGSRGVPWVMLRDETPRGFIEQRRREEERRRGSWRNGGVREDESERERGRERPQPRRRSAERLALL